MATKLVRGSLSALNTGITYVPMGSWTLNRVQDVYNKVKDTSPDVVAKSLDRVESVVQQIIANPEEASLEEDPVVNENLQSLKLPETLTDEQLELLNQFLTSMIKERETQEEVQAETKTQPAVDRIEEKPVCKKMRAKIPSCENSQLEVHSPESEQLDKPQNLTSQQLEWSRQMMRWVTVGFLAVHTGFQDIICEMEKENDRCTKYDPRRPYYMKLTTVMSRCVMDWLWKNDFLDIMMRFFNTVSLTGDILRNYILLGARMVQVCKEKLQIENSKPQ